MDNEDDALSGSPKYMDKLPTVISCCFCCFLRAGSVCIALVSFAVGVILAPNVTHSKGPWNPGMFNISNTPVEAASQMILGIISILLCVISILLLVGALCNVPSFIEWYQWGVLVYCGVTVLIYFTLSSYCLAVIGNCAIAGISLLFLIIINILLTSYFVIVVNSLRMSMIYLNSSGFTV